MLLAVGKFPNDLFSKSKKIEPIGFSFLLRGPEPLGSSG